MASKRNTRKSYNTHRRRKESAKSKSMIQDEIILVVVFVISILLFLSNFGLCGTVGGYIKDFAFGMTGLEAYLLPFILFFGTAFHISNSGNKSAGRKMISAAVFLIAFAAFLQLITVPYSRETRIFDYYTNSADEKTGGGIIGGILVMLLCRAFAVVATYIIIIAVMLISVIVITGKAILTYLAKKSKSSYLIHRDNVRLRREQMEEEGGASGIPEDRRPPKTFILDPNVNVPAGKLHEKKSLFGRDKQDKKPSSGQIMNDLPIVNLNHLDKSGEEGGGLNRSNSGQAVTIPTYEDELRNKFGKAPQPEVLKQTGPLPVINEPKIHINPVPDTIAHNDPIQETCINETPAKAALAAASSVKEAGTAGTQHQAAAKDIANDEQQKKTAEVQHIDIKNTGDVKKYMFPPLNLLTGPKPRNNRGGMTEQSLKETALKLQSTLESFGVHVTVTNVSCGPAVTRYELQPEQGVKVKSITSLADDIKLNLAAAEVRIEAPIPGKSAVGIEVPNKENSMVTLREMLESREFKEHPSDIAFAVGKDIGGQTIVTDIAKMPHLLIAGATGSGKSVCINTLIMSILYKSNPSDVRLIMVDPKVVELNVYNGIPHLLIPVVTDPKKASAALNWAVMEMTERYKKFADAGVRDIKGYNEKVAEVADLNDPECQKLPQIVIIIDELADLMMVAPGEVEDAICRLAQMARAAGLHLIIATQRPSVNVITGLIKANIPSRIAFAVSSAIDSRTIIDGSGAEKLLGKGDMLFFPSGYPKPVRIQGAFISDKEVSSVVDFLIKNNNEAQYSEEIKDQITNGKAADGTAGGANGNDLDEYFAEAGKFIIEKDKASIGMLQRVYKIGFNRAARIMDQLAEAGVVGPEEGTKPRKILMSEEQFEQYLDEN